MTLAEAEEMTLATPEACKRALIIVHGSLGVAPPVVTDDRGRTDERATQELADEFYARVNEQAHLLATGGWTPSMLRATTIGLAQDPDVDAKVRYGRCLGAVDFERVRRRGLAERTVREDDGLGTVVERLIVTRSGFALKVAAAKLYTAAEMMDVWRAGGERGRNCDGVRPDGTVRPYDDAMFTPVSVVAEDGSSTRRFRLKG
jgi:hypothetical protein